MLFEIECDIETDGPKISLQVPTVQLADRGRLLEGTVVLCRGSFYLWLDGRMQELEGDRGPGPGFDPTFGEDAISCGTMTMNSERRQWTGIERFTNCDRGPVLIRDCGPKVVWRNTLPTDGRHIYEEYGWLVTQPTEYPRDGMMRLSTDDRPWNDLRLTPRFINAVAVFVPKKKEVSR